MKNNTRLGPSLLCFSFLFVLSCQKNKTCLPPRAEINVTGSVYTGDVLQLSAVSVAGARYSWSGPNNFSSAEQNPTIQNVSLAASGDYSLRVKAGDCENTTSKEITILSAPPCNPTINSIDFLSTMNFGSINCRINAAGRYEMRGPGQQGDFWIEFYSDPIAKGNCIYELSTDHNSYNVFMQITLSGIYANWQALSGKLYVRFVNGKLTASFCDANFANLQSSYTHYGSGRISCS